MENIESKILCKAREAFIEKGYIDTSMSDIAERVGINRPTLHYYFRTKEKLFQAVFAGIILSVIPRIKEIVVQRERSIGERVSAIVDLYMDVFRANPYLPAFIVREINRDVEHLIHNIQSLQIEEYMLEVISSLREEMEDGRIRKMPVHHVFYTFYGLLTIPFLTQHLGQKLLLENESFDLVLTEWKGTIVSQMHALLSID